MKKFSRKQFPPGHGEMDFKCFGPAATKDGQFEGTMICDMGCFKQDGTDSNKFYHGAVVQSNKTQEWYAYFTWGRTGAPNPDFQFFGPASKAEAEAKYAAQLHSKNDKRGVWVTHPSLGTILQAKPKKDCYLVRPQATRSTGLPDARTITQNEGAKQAAKPSNNGDKKKTKKSKTTADSQTLSLLRDLNVGTISYTRSQMTDAAIPTQIAIDEARDILSEARKRVKKVGTRVDAQINDKELVQLTSMVYSRIPKKKSRGADASEWILSQSNISLWEQDLDAFESALYTTDLGVEVDDDPFGGMPLDMRWLSPSSELGKFIREWLPKSTKDRHGYLGSMKIKNVWEVERHGDVAKLTRAQDRIARDRFTTREKPYHQPKRRPDLDREALKRFTKSHTVMLFHGTRSVNVSGILRESLRLPRQLVGVVITGALMGPGIYWADDWKKSAGYCSLRNSYWAGGSGSISNRQAFMFVGDVVLGKPFVQNTPKGFTRPPSGHHSVFAKGGNYLANNEFIIYSADQCRLRYLAEFSA